MSLIERSVKTFESYNQGPAGNIFLTEQYLKGIYYQRDSLDLKQGKIVRGLIVLTLALAFFDNIGSPVKVGGLSIGLSNELASVLVVLVSFNMLAFVFSTIDQLMINQYIGAIGNRLGVYSFNMFNLDKSAINLWADAITPRYFGLRSRAGHKFSMYVTMVMSLLITALFWIFPAAVCVLHMLRTIIWSTPSATEILLCSTSAIAIIYSLALIIIFSLKFGFDPAHFSEVDGTPTKEFEELMQKDNETSS